MMIMEELSVSTDLFSLDFYGFSVGWCYGIAMAWHGMV